MMPLYHYRVLPVLAVAISAAYRPGEWQLALRARSEASAVELRLSEPLCAGLAAQVRHYAPLYAGALFDLTPTAACPSDGPRLLAPLDLEAVAESLEVMPHPARRLLGLRAHGRTNGDAYVAEVWGTPEQMLALAQQAEDALHLAGNTCPACGSPVTGSQHLCRVH
jgi:hypothetical protein